MNRLQQLQAALNAAIAEANAAADAALAAALAANPPRGLTAEEQAAQASYNTRIADMRGLIALETSRLERETSATSAVIDAGPVSTTPANVGRVAVSAPNITLDPMRGFRNPGEFAIAVRHACAPGGMARIDRRLVDGGLMGALALGGVGSGTSPMAAPTNYHQESNAPEGIMVPPQMSQNIWQLVFADPLLDLITVEPTNSPAVDFIKDETTPWGASGVVAAWRAEGVQMNASKLDTKLGQLRNHELYAFVFATGELLDDAPRLTDRLMVKAPAAIRWKFVEALMFGTGAGQPLGWASDNYAGNISHARTTAGQIKPDDIIKMYSRLLVQDGPDRSFWVANRDTLPDIVLRSVIGNIPIWLPSNGLAGAPNGTLLGRPLFYSEHCQTLGTKGDLQLVNPDGYYATQRGPARQDSSIHLYFDYNITAFRWMFRFGGQPMLSAAVAAAKGANTKAHFIVLNT